MSRGPRRLLDDPDFQWETGCDLVDEQSLVGGYDLAGMKEAVVAKVGAAAAAGSSALVGDGVPAVRAAASGAGKVAAVVKPLAFATVGIATVGTAFWLGVVSGPGLFGAAPELRAPAAERAAAPDLGSGQRIAPPSREAPPVAPEAPAPQSPWWLAPVEAVPPEAVGISSPPPEERRVVAVPEALLEEVVPASAPPTEADAEAEVAAREPATAAPLSPAAEYMGAMAQCDSIIHRAKERADCYRDMLHHHGGDYDATIELAWVDALYEAGDVEGTAALAARMRENPAHSLRREELLMLEAESLAKLGRCDTALLRARDLPRAKADIIRKACRNRK